MCFSEVVRIEQHYTLGKVEGNKSVGANDCRKKTFKRSLPEQIKVNGLFNSLNTLMQHTYAFKRNKKARKKRCTFSDEDVSLKNFMRHLERLHASGKEIIEFFPYRLEM
jgi:hypothetical protein